MIDNNTDTPRLAGAYRVHVEPISYKDDLFCALLALSFPVGSLLFIILSA